MSRGSKLSGCVCMLESPDASAEQCKLFTLNILSQMPQNITVVLIVNSLTLGDIFMVHNSENDKQNHQHAPDPTPNETVCSPLFRLLSGLWVVNIDVTFITRDVPQHEV